MHECVLVGLSSVHGTSVLDSLILRLTTAQWRRAGQTITYIVRLPLIYTSAIDTTCKYMQKLLYVRSRTVCTTQDANHTAPCMLVSGYYRNLIPRYDQRSDPIIGQTVLLAKHKHLTSPYYDIIFHTNSANLKLSSYIIFKIFCATHFSTMLVSLYFYSKYKNV